MKDYSVIWDVSILELIFKGDSEIRALKKWLTFKHEEI